MQHKDHYLRIVYRFRVFLINLAYFVLKLPRPLLFAGPD